VTVRTVVVDDEALVRAGFRMMLDAQPDIEVVGEAGDGRQAVEVSRRLAPDVVLMDIRMPGLDGIDATRLLVRSTRVVILTTFDLDQYVFEALAAGASGFLLKHVLPEDLVQAVRVVAAGEALLAPSITRRLIEEFVRRPAPALRGPAPPELGSLTERERQVLALLARGLTNAEIASRLHVGDATVKTHVARVLDKLDLRDRVQAVILAYELGLVTPADSA
jgi:DNA-binding NarL/FixJ family response regulator